MNLNKELENGFNEDFISNFYAELIKARHIYREALIKQILHEKNKKSLKNLLSTRTNKSKEVKGK